MEFKFQKVQAAKLLLLLLSLTLIPFVSTSLRSSYLYFLLNVFIIALGYESGILHVLMEPAVEKKRPVLVVAPVLPLPDNRASSNSSRKSPDGRHGSAAVAATEETPTAAEKTVTIATVRMVRRNPSRPSLFSIGSSDWEGEAAVEATKEEDEDVFEAVGEISAQELFARAESFIGNFYRQLKIQREESWQKIHGFYHKPF